MNAHYFQHVSIEGLGSIRWWLEAAGFKITNTSFFKSAHLPDPDEIDLLVVMGGPMSVNDEKEFPWLGLERQFIRDAIQSGKPVLGVCLGAQLIASAMGARVYQNDQKEIGWFPIQGIPSTDRMSFSFPPSAEVFHWHGETFELPSGAIHLARSEGCENQAFQLGRSVIGLQFHLETTPQSAQKMVAHFQNELVSAEFVQNAAEILNVEPEKYQSINNLMDQVLSFLRENCLMERSRLHRD